MTAATVHEFQPGAMTEAEYRREREQIAALKTGTEAQANKDQALAALFVRSGWTQERLAAIEGCKQNTISQRLTFGRFLAFIATAINPEFDVIRAQLTERKFRGYWARTNAKDGVRQRFLAVQRALIDDTRIAKSTEHKAPIGEAIKATCAGGGWHKFSTIVAKVQTVVKEATEEDVKAVLGGMVRFGSYGVFCEPKKEGARIYRIVLGGKRKINLEALQRELGPIIEALKAEGRKNEARLSPGTVAHLAWQLERAIEKLTNRTDKSVAPQEDVDG